MSDTQATLRNAQRIVSILTEERKIWRNPDSEKATFMREFYRDDYYGLRMSDEIITGWESVGRQVLAIHPALVESIRFASSSKIPPEVNRTLPYLNPMIVFPEPPAIPAHIKGETMHCLGFVCYGKTTPRPVNSGDQKFVDRLKEEFPKSASAFAEGKLDRIERITTTHDPDADFLCADMMMAVIDRDGNETYESDYISFPMTGAPYTIKQTVDRLMDEFAFYHGGDDPKLKAKFMRSIAELALGSIMYLCSTTLEAEKIPRKTVLKALNPVPRHPFSVYRVGWQIGAALSRSRTNINIDELQAANGMPQDPQHRKAHFRTVWTGPGSRIPKVAYISPYWTHIERLGTSGVNTARKVNV